MTWLPIIKWKLIAYHSMDETLVKLVWTLLWSFGGRTWFTMSHLTNTFLWRMQFWWLSYPPNIIFSKDTTREICPPITIRKTTRYGSRIVCTISNQNQHHFLWRLQSLSYTDWEYRHRLGSTALSRSGQWSWASAPSSRHLSVFRTNTG